MHNLCVEWCERPQSIAKELAERIYAESRNGKVVVVVDEPANLMSATRKQWARGVRLLQRERSATLDAKKIEDVAQKIARMQSLKFSAQPPRQALEGDITFATPDSLLRVAPICQTMFVVCDLQEQTLYMITGWMPERAKVVIYEG